MLLWAGLSLVLGCRPSGGKSSSRPEPHGGTQNLEKSATEITNENNASAAFYADAFPGVKFDRPVYLGEVPGKPDHFLVLEQAGEIQIVSPAAEGWGKSPFASINVSGGGSGGDEKGLLGFAFHPDYAANGKYYCYYLKGRRDILAEGYADTSRLKDSGRPRRMLLDLEDPYSNHNGGTLAFGPKDGFLYLGLGDGGSGGDPLGNGQNKHSLFGKFLRIDVDTRSAGKPYGIPADNPFVDGSGAPEVWAYGLRNPWKWSFDPVTGELWAGDVGQNTEEEIDRIEKGGNYGWKVREGARCFPPDARDCETTGFASPIFTYGRDAGGGISVTGGVFFRARRAGSAAPDSGVFLFGDYGTNNVWSLTRSGVAKRLPKPPAIGISSFASDSRGRVYIMGVFDETIYRMAGLDSLR
jgi:glucose/arabinose dehydrogenase